MFEPLKPISPSQLKSFDCPRKWAAEKCGYRSRPGAAALWGTGFHKVAERWIKGAELPWDDYGRLFSECFPHLPSDIRTFGVAEGRHRFELEGFTFHGDLDVRYFRPADCRAIAFDWKTSSNPTAYGLTSETLLDDWQGILYPAFVIVKVPVELESVDLHWQYFNTRTKKACPPVTATVTVQQVGEKLVNRVVPRAKRMLQVWQDLHDKSVEALNEVPHNPAACDNCGHWCGFTECRMFSGPLEKATT
jgi:hypothetical protein